MWLEESLAICRELGRLDQTAQTLGMLGWNANMRGDYAQSERYWQEKLEISQQIGHQAYIGLALNHLGWVHWCIGGDRLLVAKAHYEQALDILRTVAHKRWFCMCTADFSLTLIELGEYARTLQLAAEGTQLAKESGIPDLLAYNLASQGSAASRLGDFATARQLLWESLLVTAQSPMTNMYAHALFRIAELLVQEANNPQPSSDPRAEKLSFARALLDMACAEPGCWPAIRTRAESLAQQLDAQLPAPSDKASTIPTPGDNREQIIAHIAAWLSPERVE
jgi:tetratricopeptide (TPR) repeat protein